MSNKKRWQKLAGILKEANSAEASQDLKAYFGSNDSIDGPYTDIADEQPMKVGKTINKHLVESKYPETASEYAKQLNSKKHDMYIKLVEDPEHWAEFDIHTGEELAHYLAKETHRDLFKELYGVRPRHMKYDQMSVEEIKAKNDQLEQELIEEGEPMSQAEKAAWEEGSEDDLTDEVDIEFGKYDDLEAEWDDKVYGKR